MTHHSPRFHAAQRGKTLVLILIALVALGAGIFASGKLRQAPAPDVADAQLQEEQLATLQESLNSSLALPLDFKQIPDFSLQNANGDPLDQRVFDDKWSLVFFGYTHCPDVCPITLHVMKGVVASLEEQNMTPPQIVFVTVDPVRDTPDVMKQYVGYFDESFIGITGELNKVHALTSSLGIVASFTANDSDPDNYIVDHTASLLLIDPQKRVRAKVTPPHEADTIVADYLAIVGAPS